MADINKTAAEVATILMTVDNATNGGTNTLVTDANIDDIPSNKIEKPSTEGSNGQVLTTNGAGGVSWTDKLNSTELTEAVSDWLDEHVDPTGAAVIVDSTLTISGAAADAKVTGDELGTLRSAFNACFDSELITPVNWLDRSEMEEGYYYWTNGKQANASYTASGLIPVTVGTTYYFTRGTQTVYLGRSFFTMRFVVGYASDGTTIVDSDSYVNGETGYTVPSGVKYIRVSNDGYMSAGTYPMVQTASQLIDFVPYFDPYIAYTLKDSANNEEYIESLIDISTAEISELIDAKTVRYKTNGIKFKFDVDSDDHVYSDAQQKVQDMFNYSIQFTGKVTTLTGLAIGHGYQAYMGGYVVITPTHFSYYLGSEASPRVSEAHNLTLKDYIAVRIDAKPNRSADFTIYTNGGTYTKTNQTWDVRSGSLCVMSVDGTNTLSDCELSYMCKGWGEKIHLYGDSYFGVYDDKWTHYLTKNNWMKNNVNGYPGRASLEALNVLRTVVANSNPEKIIWCMGMNNPDSGAINASWKTCVDALMEICTERKIELILATIPNVATVDNTYKNAYVRESGYRYIDFASAVGASEDTTWFDGMLSNDGVHPTNIGAIALFNQAIADVPELMQ